MKKFLLGAFMGFALSIALVGCNGDSPTITPVDIELPGGNLGSDGYRFSTPEFMNSEVKITFITYNTSDELHAALIKRFKETNTEYTEEDIESVGAWSTVYPSSSECTIHYIDPFKVYIPEYLGHEITHCIYGNFHKNQTEENMNVTRFQIN